MKITNMRIKGEKLSGIEMNNIMVKLRTALNKRGFITNIVVMSGSSLNLSNNGSSFVIDTAKLGYNARVNTSTVQNTKKGYRRTNVPTWFQREDYNHVINSVLDKYKITATIKSGEFTVRTTKGKVTEWDMPETVDNGLTLQVPSTLEIVPLEDAQIAVNNYGINAPIMFSNYRNRQFSNKLEKLVK